jgi:beta-phosphoglucomutase-like phosphatase (HAD superfamily)
MPPAAILDIDGTLVDTNYHHAIAWYRAFRQHELIVPLWRIHRAIGMGSDMLVEHFVGKDKDEELGDSIRAAEGPLYLAFIEEAEPLEGARGLIEDLKQRGLEGRAGELGQGQRARPLPRPARRRASSPTTGRAQTTSSSPSPSPTSSSPRWRRPAPRTP